MLATSWHESARTARAWAADVLELVVPPLCEACGRRTERGCVLCSVCVEALPRTRARDATGKEALLVVSPFRYEGEIARRVMRRFKYQGARDLAAPLAREMAAAWRRAGLPSTGACLVPVPVSPDRHRLRGFNQAALLAHALGDALGLAVAELARRARTARSQTSLTPGARARNIARAFEGGHASPRWPLVLVDDVSTTGATLSALFGSLASNGHAVIGAITAFRTPPGRESAGAARSAHGPAGAERHHELFLEK